MNFFKTLQEYRDTVEELVPLPWMKKENFILVENLDQLRELVDAAIEAGLSSLDLETTGLDNRLCEAGRTKDEIVGYCISYDGIKGYYIPIGHKDPDTLGDHPKNIRASNGTSNGYVEVNLEIKRLVENCVIIYHNSAFDQEFLFGSSAKIDSTDPNKFEDTLILDYLRNSTDKRHGLKYLSERFLNKEMFDLKDLFPPKTKDMDFSTRDPSHQNTLYYTGSDGICTYLLFKFYQTHNWKGEPESNPKKTIYGEQTRIYQIEKELIPALRWLERSRMQVDVPYIKRLKKEVELMIEEALVDINVSLIKGINNPAWPAANANDPEVLKSFQDVFDVKSPQQLGKALLELKKENPHFRSVELEVTEKSGQVRTNDEAIESLYKRYGDKFPFLKSIQTFRSLQKVLGTYIQPLHDNSDWKESWYKKGEKSVHTDRKHIKDDSIRFRFLPNRVDTGRFAAAKGTPSHGFSGVNVQSMPACRKSVEITGRYVSKRPSGEGTGDVDPKVIAAQRSMGYQRRIYDGHFIQNHRNGAEFCIRTSCEGCPFEASCVRGPTVKEPFYTVENAVRPALIAREGCVLVACDFAGLELRAAANIANEPVWIHEFNHGDADLHKITAILVYGEQITNLPPSEFKLLRENAKGVNFSIIYGGGGSAIARATGVSTEEGNIFRNRILTGLPSFSSWMENTIKQAHRTGEVTTTTGRKIRLPDINSSERWLRAKQERNAINSIVQGTATGDLIKYAMGSVYRTVVERGWQDVCRMVLTIHDELVFEIQNDYLDEIIPVLERCMAEFADLEYINWPVKLETDVEFNTNWSPRYDWGKIHELDSKTGLAKQATPKFLKDKIKFSEGMFYEEEEGTKFIWTGTGFVEESQYTVNSTMNVITPESEVAVIEDDMEDLIAEHNNALKAVAIPGKEIPNEIEATDGGLPYYRFILNDIGDNSKVVRRHFQIERLKSILVNYWVIVEHLELPEAFTKDTHRLKVENADGTPRVLEEFEEDPSVNIHLFNVLAVYEGI